MPTELTTISGKPITATISFRLPAVDYDRLYQRAIKEGKTVSELLQEWVLKRLQEPEEPNEA